MKILLNILKAFLINITFIGIIFASNSCPSIHPQDAKDLPVEQVEAVLGDILCSFIDLHTDCLLYTSPSPRDVEESRMPSSA